MEKINEISDTKKILISPLDWGWGHTTRCIPLIHLLRTLNCKVIVAADKNQEMLIRSEFRDIAILRIEGYGISYSRKKAFFLWKLLLQLPKIYTATKKENKWVKKITEEHQIDGIISDNRLGFYNKKIPSVFITHQLSVQTGYKFINAVVRKIYYNYINRFSECWVPDVQSNDHNLSGILSHPETKPAIPVKYTGILSRFKKQTTEIKNNILIVISGPEPQRTIFENIILQQLTEINSPVVLVRGITNDHAILSFNHPHVTIFNHVYGEKLNGLMQSASLVISRAGYSSIMDLVTIGKNAILVPTPGQTEQEYLAEHLSKQGYFFTKNQNEFILKDVISASEKFNFQKLPQMKFDTSVITDWLKAL